jgi:hypothetical protein
VYHGIWGTAPFQSVDERPVGALSHLPHMPEWHLVNAALLLITLTGIFWPPLLWTLPLLIVSVLIPIIQGARAARSVPHKAITRSGIERVRLQIITAFLHITQPMARLYGRVRQGVAPWRNRSARGLRVPRVWIIKRWTDRWRSPEDRLKTIERSLRAARCFVVIGGDYDRWDFNVRGGFLGAARLLSAVEEHGGGCQTVRFRVWPTWSWLGLALLAVLTALAWGAARDQAWIACGTLGVAAGVLGWRILLESAFATAALLTSIEQE